MSSAHPSGITFPLAVPSPGRDAAGVHWPSDSAEGLKLGEAVAIGILTDLKATCHEPARGLRLTKFDGTTVVV